jgi:hypothetical protein
MWAHGEYLLATVVAGYSGIWPHLKLGATLLVWFQRCSERRRGAVLHYAGAMAMWWGPAEVARIVIGCRSTQGTRVHRSLDEVTGNVCQVLRQGQCSTSSS